MNENTAKYEPCVHCTPEIILNGLNLIESAVIWFICWWELYTKFEGIWVLEPCMAQAELGVTGTMFGLGLALLC